MVFKLHLGYDPNAMKKFSITFHGCFKTGCVKSGEITELQVN